MIVEINDTNKVKDYLTNKKSNKVNWISNQPQLKILIHNKFINFYEQILR